jgi:hypothetical protein
MAPRKKIEPVQEESTEPQITIEERQALEAQHYAEQRLREEEMFQQRDRLERRTRTDRSRMARSKP